MSEDERPIDRVIEQATEEFQEALDADPFLRPFAGEREGAEEAFAIDARIREQKLRVEEGFVALGRDLAEMRDRELYRALDFETFEAYVASPERGFSRRTAYSLIAAADVVQRLHMSPEQAGVIGHVKLAMIRTPLVQERGDPADLVHDAAALAASDLRERIRALGVEGPVTTEEQEREEDRIFEGRLLDFLTLWGCGIGGIISYGRWSGLRIVVVDGPTLKVWAAGGRLLVEFE